MDGNNTGKQPTIGALAGGAGSDPGDVPGSTLASAAAADMGMIDWGLGLGLLELELELELILPAAASDDSDDRDATG